MTGQWSMLAKPILGTSGNDSLSGTDADDTLIGMDGLDTLFGGAGRDTLLGGDGRDILIGGTGADLMVGGEGNDRYYVDDPGDRVVEIGPPVSFDRPPSGDLYWVGDSVTTTLSYRLGTGIEALVLDGSADLGGWGNASDNYLEGNSGANQLSGEAGRDRIRGRGGDDVIFGGDGDDGWTHQYEDVFGDTKYYGLEGGAGSDTIYGGLGDDGLSGGSGNDILFGEDGNDDLIGGLGDDLLIGGDGDDRMYLSAYDFTSEPEDGPSLGWDGGGAGNDTLIGGAGRDNYSFGSTWNGDDLILDFTRGEDVIDVRPGYHLWEWFDSNGDGVLNGADERFSVADGSLTMTWYADTTGRVPSLTLLGVTELTPVDFLTSG
ncbi:calcium-binding protein [Azospirillum thermophilum]|uniref:Calcium-binding protein n=1 Tax=Azospirillum thermophilum TaxID=2202148 RepID=A0A2S2CU95_9PROT|nr:calcium-binding protein [Azospirillum thermophilum]AWK88093.1 hypothetical protein DEW08_18360 [Azospirillum thermophilum]